MTEHAVVIVGGGPTGMVLAAELALAKIDVANVELADRSLRAQYLVGCDGGRSVVRKAAGIDFAGWEATISSLIAEVEMAEQPELGTRQDALGVHGIGRLDYEIVDGDVVFADE